MIFEDSDIKINPGCAVFVTTESLVVITGLPRNSHRVCFHCNYTTLLLPKNICTKIEPKSIFKIRGFLAVLNSILWWFFFSYSKIAY